MAYDGCLKFDTSMDASGFQKGANQLDSIVKGLGVFKIIEKGLQIVSDSIDSAVTRVDTLNRFPRMMEQMGYGADEAKNSIAKLSDGIQGLPTALDSIVGSTQRLTLATGDLGKGTDSALALNNALLASGASTEAASRGTEQYIQSLSRGKIEGEEWKTLLETMPYAMQEVATSFGYTGTSAVQDLHAAMSSGEITMTQFNDKLIELNGGVNGFAAVAQTASGGIATSWGNVQTAVVRGVANVIDAVDKGLVSFGGISGVLNSVKSAVDKAFSAIASGANLLMQNLDKVALAMVGVGTAFAAYKGIEAWNAALKAAAVVSAELTQKGAVLSLTIDKETIANKAAYAEETRRLAIAAKAKAERLQMIAAQAKANASTMAETAIRATGTAQIEAETLASQANSFAKVAQKDAASAATAATAAETVATEAAAAAQASNNAQVSLGTALVMYLTGSMDKNTLSTLISTTATTLFGAAMKALPLVGVAAAIGALVIGIVALVKWLAAGSEAYQEQKKEVDALKESQEKLVESAEESAAAYESNTAEITAQSKVQRNLVKDLKNVQKSTQTATEKQRKMADIVAQLNSSVEGLNVAYDEETGAIRNINTGQEVSLDQLEQLVDAKAKLAEANAWQERANELVKEQVEIQENLAVIEDKKQKILADSTLSTREQNNLIKELDESAVGYAASMEDVEARLQIVNENLSTSNTDMAQAVEDDYARMEQAVTGSGESIEAVAGRWGVSVEAIQAAWTNAGGSFDEFVSRQDEVLGHSQELITKYADIVTDGFSVMAQESAISWDTFLTNIGKNTEATANWASNMNTLMDYGIHEGIIANLAAAGPESAVQLQLFTDELNKMNGDANIALGEVSDTVKVQVSEINGSFEAGLEAAAVAASAKMRAESYYASGYASVDQIATGITENQSAVTASTQLGENIAQGASNGISSTDFASVGQTAGAGLTSGLSSAVQAGSTAVIASVSGMASSVQSTVNMMAIQTRAAVAQMMTQINSAILSGSFSINASVNACTRSITTAITTLKTKAQQLTLSTMVSVNTIIALGAPAIEKSVAALASSVVDALRPMIGEVKDITVNMMDGIGVAMDEMAPALFAKAESIANGIAKTMARALNVRSPSRVMIALFENVMMGVYKGMDGMTGLLYRTAEKISDGIAQRIAISPDLLMNLTQQVGTGTIGAQLQATVQSQQSAIATRMGATNDTQRTAVASSAPASLSSVFSGLKRNIEISIPVMLGDREIYKAVKNVEETYGYNVGGMQHAW